MSRPKQFRKGDEIWIYAPNIEREPLASFVLRFGHYKQRVFAGPNGERCVGYLLSPQDYARARRLLETLTRSRGQPKLTPEEKQFWQLGHQAEHEEEVRKEIEKGGKKHGAIKRADAAVAKRRNITARAARKRRGK
jgi:hypothetical protein